jgi:hypothetical protein
MTPLNLRQRQYLELLGNVNPLDKIGHQFSDFPTGVYEDDLDRLLDLFRHQRSTVANGCHALVCRIVRCFVSACRSAEMMEETFLRIRPRPSVEDRS